MEEGRKLGEETDMNVIIHAQSFGRGGEQVLSWFEIYDDYAQRAKTRYASDKWNAYIDKFNKSEALVATRSYQMISLDPIVPDDYIVTNYMWQPNKGKRQDTLDALERAKIVLKDMVLSLICGNIMQVRSTHFNLLFYPPLLKNKPNHSHH